MSQLTTKTATPVCDQNLQAEKCNSNNRGFRSERGNKETTIQTQVVVIEPTEHLLQELLKQLNTLLDSHIVFRRMNRNL